MISTARRLTTTIAALLLAAWAPGLRAEGAAPSVVRISVIDDRSGAQPLPAGTTAPAIERAKRLDGAEVDVPLSTTTPTVVNVWATWCPPCVRELPDLAAVSQRHGAAVKFVGLAHDSPHGDVVAMIARFATTYDVFEIDDRVARSWRIVGLPSTYIVDAAGVVQWSVSGGIDAATLDAQLTAIVQGGALRPGEHVLGSAFAIRKDGVVVTTHEVVDAARGRDGVVALTADGVAHAVTGVLAAGEQGGAALLKIDATTTPLVVAEEPAAHVGTPGFASGTALVDAAGRVVGVTTSAAVVPAAAVHALVAATNLDAQPAPLGPDVRRNLIISAIVFGVVGALAFGVPPIVRAVQTRRKRRPRVVH